MKVLIACEFSGIVREAFKARGHDAWSCDLGPTEIEGNHLQCDVREILGRNWDLMIAHPPCTYLANSGVRWLYNKDGSLNEERWALMEEGARFFLTLLGADIPKIAVENPTMHGYAQEMVVIPSTQEIEPRWFGDAVSKKTHLWLKNLEGLSSSNWVSILEVKDSIHREPPGPEREKNRSRFFPGVARAMAEQWDQ